MVGIYKITNPKGCVYIGQSWNLSTRKSQYKTRPCKKQRYIYNSLMKYGWEKHKFEIIHELPKDVSQQILDEYEILYWQLYKDCNVQLMNIKEPGKGGKNSEEMKENMRKNSFYKGKTGKNSPSFGSKRSLETRTKMSELNKARDPDWRKSFRKTMYQYSLDGNLVNSYIGVRNKTTDFVKLLNKYCNRYKIIKSHNFIWSKEFFTPEIILLNNNIKTINHKNGTEQYFKSLH